MGGDQAPPKPPPVLIASGPPSGPPGMLIQFAPSQSQTIALIKSLELLTIMVHILIWVQLTQINIVLRIS